MILHHEIISAAAPVFLTWIAWGLLAINAAAYYGRKVLRYLKRKGD